MAAFDADTVLVGHSGRAALLLAVLEHLDVTIAQTVLVAGYSTRPNDSDEPVRQDRYDWSAIKALARELVFITSPDDRNGCDDRQGRAMFDRLGGTLIIRDGGPGGHFRGVRHFELLHRLIV